MRTCIPSIHAIIYMYSLNTCIYLHVFPQYMHIFTPTLYFYASMYQIAKHGLWMLRNFTLISKPQLLILVHIMEYRSMSLHINVKNVDSTVCWHSQCCLFCCCLGGIKARQHIPTADIGEGRPWMSLRVEFQPRTGIRVEPPTFHKLVGYLQYSTSSVGFEHTTVILSQWR